MRHTPPPAARPHTGADTAHPGASAATHVLAAPVRVAVAALLAVAVVVAVASPADADDASDGRLEDRVRAEHVLYQGINDSRADAGVDPLPLHPDLVDIARAWSEEMAADHESGTPRRDALAHNPDVRAQISERIGSAATGNENVGMTIRTGASAEWLAERLDAAFLDSDAHRRNRHNARHRATGVGVAFSDDGTMWTTHVYAHGDPVVATADDHARVLAAADLFDPDGGTVGIARAGTHADALAAAPLLGDDGGLLLADSPLEAATDPILPAASAAALADALDRGDVGEIVLLGGESAVSPRVADDVAELAADAGVPVDRIAGDDRHATAAEIADHVDPHASAGGVLVAADRAWPDAVSGGAAAAQRGWPVLLAGKTEVPDATADALAARSAADRYAIGGPAVLADGLVDQLAAQRLAGDHRSTTSVAVAESLADASAPVTVSAGFGETAWAQALAAAPTVAAERGALVLADPDTGDPIGDWLERRTPSTTITPPTTP